MARTKHPTDALIERIYYANCAGVQVSILDIGSIFAAGRAAATKTGGDVAAITAAVVARVLEVAR